jgi:DNA-binding NarL/FixJ family response regulator
MGDAAGITPHIEPIRVLVADDQPWVRVGLKTLLELEEGLSVVGECDSGEAVLEWLEEESADVVLLDIRMPGLGGIATAERLREYPVGVILLTTFEEEEDMIAGLRSGAGYLLKDVSVEELVAAIVRTARGDRVIQPRISEFLADHLARRRVPLEPVAEKLTPRETEILALLAKQLSNKRIAKALNLTEGTVKVHVSSILSKLGAADRGHAVQIALKQHLLSARG